jgi:hypothetical protein
MCRNLDVSLLNYHDIIPYLFKFHEFRDSDAKTKYTNTWRRNINYQNLIKELGQSKPKDLRVTLLKGAALSESIYSDLGSRPMCDLDLLVDYANLNRCVDWLKEYGFDEIVLESWKGDNFKRIFSLSTNQEDLIVEVHTRLFWHLDNDQYKYIDSRFSGFSLLAPEYQLVHLIGHLAFQHTFSKLIWIVDIYEFFQYQKPNMTRVEEICREKELYSSFKMVVWILKNNFGLNVNVKIQVWEKFLYRIFLDEKFLIDPNSNKFKYFVVKHFVKDSLLDAIKYDFLWLLNRIKKKS